MNRKSIFFLAIALTFFGTTVLQSASRAEEHTVMHFADLGGIRNWQPGPNDSLLIEGRKGVWFRVTFWGPCHELKFAEAIGFVTEPTGDLDKFSSLLAGGERCWFKTFERTSKP